MDKRVFLAAALSISILILWNVMVPPPERPQVPPSGLEPTAETTPGQRPDDDRRREPSPYEPDYDDPVDEEPAPEAVQASSVQTVTVETDLYRVELTNEGGGATSWKLIEYRTTDGEPLELLPQFTEKAPLTLALDVDDRELTELFGRVLYEVRRESLSAGAGERITFAWSDGRGLSAWKGFTFRNGSYLVDVELEVTERGRRLPARLALGPGFGAQEKTSSYHYEAWALDQGGQVQHFQKNKRKGYPAERGGTAGDIYWAGLEDQYFAALILLGSDAAPARVHLDPVELQRLPVPGSDDETKAMHEVVLSLTVPEEGAQLFFGPKNYRMLESMGIQLEEVVWFFKNGFLSWIARHIYLGLLWLQANVVSNYGLAIILATVILRVLLFPVNQYSMVKMKKTQLQMSRLQPKIKAIRNKFKQKKDADSRNKMNQEMMELYKREGVNPMGGITGCLPMLGQFPILIGFYGMLTVAVELRGAPFFGWIHDLSRADPYWITPILMGVTMFVQQGMAMSKVKDPMQQQQQRIMMIMPVMFTVICLSLPSGLVLYWFVNNLLGIGQQYLVNKHTGKLEAHVETSPRKKESDDKPTKPEKRNNKARRLQEPRKKKVAR